MITAIDINQKKISINENKEIARGGEGRIILLKSGKEVAKIFHKYLDLSLRPHFDFLMKLSSDLFLAPNNILFKNNKIIGYIMPFLSADYVPISSLFNQNFCKKHSIDLTKKRKLIKQLHQAIKQAHASQIILGDFNPYNIMLSLSDYSLKIIDTDSFETPYRKHTGLMLEDIRDYYQQGIINQTSDYFAFSVLVFNLLSYAHPFKGIHSKHKSLKDRMVNNVPIFNNEVKKPKCYIPQSADLQLVFDDFFLYGKRYLVDFNHLAQVQKIASPLINDISANDLFVKEVLAEQFVEFDFNENYGFVKTQDKWLIYEAVEKSKLVLRKSYDCAVYDKIFLAKNTVVGVKSIVWTYDIQSNAHEIKNIKLSAFSQTYNYNGIVALLSDGAMFKVFLDEIIYQNIRMERVEVFVEGIRSIQSFVQQAGGVQNVFYKNKTNLSTIRLEKRVLNIVQKDNFAMISQKENNQIKYKFITIEGLKFKEFKADFDESASFAVQKSESGKKILFFCTDNYIEVRDSLNLSILTKFAFKGVSALSEIYSTKAGLVILENNKMFLVNKK